MANCTHGFPQGQCLICSTLARTAGGAGNTTTVADKPASPVQLEELNGGPAGTLLGPKVPKVGQPMGLTEEKARGRGSARNKLAVALVVIVAGLLAWGLFQGLFDLALRIAEYVVLAVAAGWVGYKVGHYRGRRETQHGSRRPD